FPEANAEALQTSVVFQAPEGEKLTDPENQAVVQRVIEAMAADDKALGFSDPFADGNSGVSQDGSTAYAFGSYDVNWGEVTDELTERFEEAADIGRDAGLRVESSGEIAEPEEEPAGAEMIGIVVAAIVLLITFGSLVAAGLPLITAMVGVSA